MKITVTAESVPTSYWSPGENYLKRIVGAVKGKIENGNILIISEKALSTAKGYIIDESGVEPGLVARFIARFWMRFFWGYFFGSLCRLKRKNIRRLRNYPLHEGSKHKQVSFWYAGFFQALIWGSEGAIDSTNLPYSYVSLPLNESERIAEEISEYVKESTGKKIGVMITDTDKTYKFRNIYFTPRPEPMKGIYSFPSLFAYICGRFLGLKRSSTPLAVFGVKIRTSLALDLADIADRRRGSGAGYTVWDMADKFKVGLSGTTWKMLRSIRHIPIVIIRIVSDHKIHIGL